MSIQREALEAARAWITDGEETLSSMNAVIAQIDAALSAPTEQAPAGLVQTGIELAARWVEKRAEAYQHEHGSIDPDTGTVEYPGTGEEYYGELLEIAEGIRGLAAQPATPVAPKTLDALTDGEVDDLCREMVRGGKSVNWLAREFGRRLAAKNNMTLGGE